jgi:uncharacterized membrane protein
VTTMLIAVAALTVINLVYKGIGPAILGDRILPPRVQGVIDAFPAALLAGLLLVNLLGERWAAADWTALPGLLTASVAWYFRLPQLACVAIAVVVTIVVRFLV